MAWTNLTFSFGSLLTSTKMTQLDDNLDALAAGSAGAPTIQTAAVADGAITPVKMSAVEVGDYLLHTNAAEQTTTSASYVKLKETIIGQSGTYRIKFDMKKTAGGAQVYGRVYRNGVAVGTEQNTTSVTYVTFSEDIAGWSAGDLIQVYANVNISPSVEIQNLILYESAASVKYPITVS